MKGNPPVDAASEKKVKASSSLTDTPTTTAEGTLSKSSSTASSSFSAVKISKDSPTNSVSSNSPQSFAYDPEPISPQNRLASFIRRQKS
eukprot:Awhi_evm1s3076